MHVFNSRADFDAQMKSVKKWMRTGQALDGVSELQHDVAYSIGDSLVYWWVNAHEAATADLVGHRRGGFQGRSYLYARLQRYRRSRAL